MRTIGNILWMILIGLWALVAYYIAGIFFCITIIGIPCGKQLFKMGHLAFLPFGKEAKLDFEKHPILNIFWVIFMGWGMALGYIVAGLFFYIIIIGIPFGKQCFKLAKLAFIPFGAEIVAISSKK